MDIKLLSVADEDDAYRINQAAAAAEAPDIPFWSRAAFDARVHQPWPGSLWEFFIARTDEGTPAGLLEIGFPQLENTSTSNIQLNVHPDHRRRGIGRALYAHAVERSRAHGRTFLIAPTVDSLPDGPAFATAMGAAPALAETRSRLDVADFDALELRAPVADGYRLAQWTDHTPDEYVHDVAYLDSRLNVDAPTGDLAWEAEKVDAERVRENEKSILSRNRTAYHSGAVHTATGRLVAWTLLTCPNDIRWQAWQQITIVDPEHRGHGLGLTVKIANLTYARSTRPELRAIDTFNASSNAPMLRVNQAMGFRARETWTQWQATI
ncbi:GNAT family N-acetyltransferase [Actinoplanes sp. N902-109]|uniref:GNAT family N-acetyltransferase n=1 Tax=Actinoplanes sp. (strain N902-109) TaxID=649831 RepID=UPI00032948F2|nr:GNAT family N-acetyltransferase [Actinoplanes sp. N902-109]AGL21298.1 GCN5 N-acetyltransferase [Actinoplanes sp. N902-109]